MTMIFRIGQFKHDYLTGAVYDDNINLCYDERLRAFKNHQKFIAERFESVQTEYQLILFDLFETASIKRIFNY